MPPIYLSDTSSPRGETWSPQSNNSRSAHMTPTLDAAALNLDAPFQQFISQLNSRSWSPAELTDAIAGIQDRLDIIDHQLTAANIASRGLAWKTSTETARKYFHKKMSAVLQVSRRNEPPPVKKPAGGHGFLLTMQHNGENLVLATKRNPSELWAEMIAEEEAKGSAPPALIAFLSLTEEAAKALPESLWVDDL